MEIIVASYKDRRKSPCEDERGSFRIYFEPVHSCLCSRAVFTCADTEKHCSRKRAIFFSWNYCCFGKTFSWFSFKGFLFCSLKGCSFLSCRGNYSLNITVGHIFRLNLGELQYASVKVVSKFCTEQNVTFESGFCWCFRIRRVMRGSLPSFTKAGPVQFLCWNGACFGLFFMDVHFCIVWYRLNCRHFGFV